MIEQKQIQNQVTVFSLWYVITVCVDIAMSFIYMLLVAFLYFFELKVPRHVLH